MNTDNPYYSVEIVCDLHQAISIHGLLIDPETLELGFLEEDRAVAQFVQTVMDVGCGDFQNDVCQVFSDWRSAWDQPDVRAFVDKAQANSVEPIDTGAPVRLALWSVLNNLAGEIVFSGVTQGKDISLNVAGWILDDDETGRYLLKKTLVVNDDEKLLPESLPLSTLLMLKECQVYLRHALELFVLSLEFYRSKIGHSKIEFFEGRSFAREAVQDTISQFMEQVKKADIAYESIKTTTSDCAEWVWIENASRGIKHELEAFWLELEIIKGRLNTIKAMMLGESRAAEKYYLGRLETFKNYVALAMVNESFNPVGIVDSDFLLSVFRAQFQVELTKPGKDRNYMALCFGLEAWKTNLNTLNEQSFRAPADFQAAWEDRLNSEVLRHCFGSWGKVDPQGAEKGKQILLGFCKGKTGEAQVLIAKLIGKEKAHIQKVVREARAIIDSKWVNQEKKLRAGGLACSKKVPVAASLAVEIGPSASKESLDKAGRPPKEN